MARKERSAYVKQRLIEIADLKLKQKERARHLYNYLYRRSRFFKASIYIRLAAIVFSIYMVHFNFIIISSWQEIVTVYNVDETHFGNRTDSRDHKSIYLTTNLKNNYVIDLLKSEPDKFRVKDTVIVSRTVFGKKTYVEKLHGQTRNILVELARCNNYLIFVYGFTLLSFMLKDGYDFFSRLIMRSVLLFDIAGVILYILT